VLSVWPLLDEDLLLLGLDYPRDGDLGAGDNPTRILAVLPQPLNLKGAVHPEIGVVWQASARTRCDQKGG
jgi:hypothetical protein